MAGKLSPIFNDQTFDSNGAPASGYKLFTYAAGSSTKQAAYTDSAGTIPQTNPIILDSRGYPTNGSIWLTSGQAYKFVLAPANDTDPPASPIKTFDNIAGVNDTTSTASQFQASGVTPTYVSATSFTLPGDQTSEFHIGRRLQFTVTAGTVYGRITNSVFASLTTVTVQMDGSQVLDSGLSAVQLALLRADVPSSPIRAGTAAGTDTYTVTLGAARLVKDDQYQVKIANPNTSTAPTLNIDSLGAKTIVLPNGAALYAGALSGEHSFRFDGTNMVLLNPSKGNAQSFTNFQVFNGNGTFTVPAGVYLIHGQAWGGGGGGGASATSGGGGGGGGYGEGTFAVTPGQALSVTVGGGGAGSTVAANPGATGGTSSISALLSASGGSGGSNSSQGFGGTSGASINVSGQTGMGAGGAYGSGDGGSAGGAGGFGARGGVVTGVVVGGAGQAPGGGGAGGYNAAGGSGAAGRVIIWW